MRRIPRKILNCLFCNKLLTEKQLKARVNAKYCSSSHQLKYEYQMGLRDGKKTSEKAHEIIKEKGHYKRDNSYLIDNNPARQIEARRKISVSKTINGNARKRSDLKSKTWNQLIKIIKERDDYCCKLCLAKEEQIPFHIHHIVPFRISKSNNEENLVLLCPSCHAKETAKELREFKVIQAVK